MNSPKKYMLIFCASFGSLLAGGVIFGFSALQSVFEREGLYSGLCGANASLTAMCIPQTAKIDNIFVVASGAFGIFVWPNGWLLDRFGPRFACCFGGIIYTVGAVLVMISCPQNGVLPETDFHLVGLSLISIAGPAVVFSAMHLSNVFPGKENSIITLLNVMLDGSSVVFVVFEQLNYTYKLDSYTFFQFLAGVGVFIFLTSLVLNPDKCCRAVVPEAGGENLEVELYLQNHLQPMTYLQQIRTSFFQVGLWFTTLHLLRINFYIVTVHDQLKHIIGGPATKVDAWTRVFAWSLPLGGILCAPLVGGLLDNVTRWKSIFLLNFIALAFGILSMINVLWVQVYTHILLSYSKHSLSYMPLLCPSV
jgi:hypothetical protein